MKLRMTLATLALAVGTLAGCGTEEEPSTSAPSPTATSESPEPEPTETTQGPGDLTGVWSAPEADWTVRFEADGTFTEDYQGVEDFRTGEYTVEGDTVTLVGGDGNSVEGTIEGEQLVFRLGTLTRK